MHPQNSLLWLSLVTLAVAAPCRAGVVDLTHLPAVRKAGTYTYYAGQTESQESYFTTKFYPNSQGAVPADKDGDLDDSGQTAESISIGRGDLTDHKLDGSPQNATAVSGWMGRTSYVGKSTSAFPGQFDIVFDLGEVYDNISVVSVTYSDTPGHRFDPKRNAQVAFYGTKPPDGSTAGGLSPFAQATAVTEAKNGDMLFAADGPVRARYIVVRFSVLVSGSGNASVGGYLHSIRILQTTSD